MSITNIGSKFQEVKNSLNLIDVATRLGASLTKQSGSNAYQGICPTGHTSSSGKSFHIDSNLEVFHCFNCGIGGDVISLVESVKGLSKWDSLKWLVNEFNLKVDLGQPQHSHKPTPEEIKEASNLRERSIIFEKIFEHGKKLLYEKEGSEALKYLTDVRGYDIGVLKNTEWFYLGKGLDAIEHIYKSFPELKTACGNTKTNGFYGDNFRLAFPYRNKDGVITGFLKRATKSKGITVTIYDGKTHSNIRWDSTPPLEVQTQSLGLRFHITAFKYLGYAVKRI
jgi:DNA primase